MNGTDICDIDSYLPGKNNSRGGLFVRNVNNQPSIGGKIGYFR